MLVTDPPAHVAALAAARADLASDRPADATAFQSRWKTRYLATLPYDPLSAAGLDRLTASRLGVSSAEQQALAQKGFVVSARQTFPTFFYGYKAIYADHLPLFVSVDSVMHAVHRSYDAALAGVENGFMLTALKNLLAGMHADLASGRGSDLPPEVTADVDLYLTVARQLLGDTTAVPVAGANPTTVSTLVTAAKAGAGIQPVVLFGQERDVDFSQFQPRGHYAGDSRLEAYFRAMIWLGRTDFRFLQFDTGAPAAAPRFFRRQFLAALLLGELAEDGGRLAAWEQMDSVLRGFVGESDNMTVADFSALRATTGAATSADLAGLSDDVLAQALLDGGFGIQRIASQILLVPPEGANAPLDRVFLFFGQRFVVDSQVFSDVVFDRVMGTPKRMLPNPLDVAFAALGNDAAAPLLATELSTYPNYPGALHDARRLVDQHGDDFWGASLYGAWLGALRGLSIPDGDPTAAAGLPSVMQTEPWARRVVSTQLASWAELRHDTLLYAKQSYTAIPLCDFPDAYVDPYPEAWAGIVRLAKLGQAIGSVLPISAGPSTVTDYFARVESAATTLGAMAQAERAGQPLSADQLAFINQAVDEVTSSGGCVKTVTPTGWYPQLFLTASDAQKTDPTIADVHTDPADGKILHVATGLPRLMYVTVDGCNGPRAYAGVVSSYFEQTTDGLQRLTDTAWSSQVMASPPPPDVPWVTDLVAP
ncbi:MAG TPA: DUF3160 domain-containing protein [Polyangia bacterium]|nr:DUF3160 domain-containing protein [Polyangia bacterium]